jgi:hypothetical protein
MELDPSNGNFLTGQSVPLPIPSSVRREWQINGNDAEFLAEVEVELAQMRGYQFRWGQIVEELFHPAACRNDPASVQFGAFWNFVMTDLHDTFLDVGGNLGELSDLAVDMIEDIRWDALVELPPDRRPDGLPEYIVFGEGDNISAFEIAVLGDENVEKARQWVDRFVIHGMLPILSERLRSDPGAA